MAFLNAVLLVGLLVVVIPPVLHLFNRRRHDEVDWAAMQFLRLNPTARRKLVWEQVLLMLVRMGVLTGVVLALAAPAVDSSFVGRLTPAAERDVVLILDGSASMGYKPSTPAAEAAKQWAAEYIGRLRTGDRVAVLQARQRPVALIPSLTSDHEQTRNSLELLGPPAGTADWPTVLQTALALLDGGRPNRHVIVVTDGQRYGWADETTLARWELLRKTTGRDSADAPRVWVVNVAVDRPANIANWSLDPITAGRAVAAAGRDVTFRSAVRATGAIDAFDPGKVTLEVDGRAVAELKPEGMAPTAGPAQLRFSLKFAAGSHVVTLKLAPDDLPTDNRQDFALEVLPTVPVLIVDGDPNRLTDAEHGTQSGPRHLLADALAPPKDPAPAFAVRVMPAGEFRPGVLTQDVKGPGTQPRVLVLADLEKLTAEQQHAVEKYLSDGGSVLVTLGGRCDAAAWNRVAFRGGQGFLPARVVEPVGSAEDSSGAPRPDPASFTQPAVEVFREPLPGGLHTAVFPRRWKLDPTAGVNGVTGSPVARLMTGEPLLVERGYGSGRVIVSAVPLDASWGTSLPRLPDFVRLAHELMYYLCGARGADRNVDPSQPIVFAPNPYEPPGPVTVLDPGGQSHSVPVAGWPAVIDGPHDPGAYRLTTPAGRTHYFAVRHDPQEAVLTPCSDEDRLKVSEAVGRLAYISTPDEITDDPHGPARREGWWLLMIVVVGLLGLEVWYTRRLSRADP
jgi:hypothetical protein